MADLKKQFKKLKAILGDSRDLQLSDEDALRYQDVLLLLERRGYLYDVQADGMNWYRKMAEWDGFEEWLNEEIREDRRLSRREWMIGIIGALIGLLPTIIPYLKKVIEKIIDFCG